MARPYDYAITYAPAPGQEQSPIESSTPVSAADYQLMTYPAAAYAQQHYEYQHQQHAAAVSNQVSAQDAAAYSVEHAQMVASQQQQQHIQRQMSQVSASHIYESPSVMRNSSYPSNPRKRSYQEDTSPYDSFESQMSHYAAAADLTSPGGHPQLQPTYPYHVPSHRASPTHQQPHHQMYHMQHTHHHRLPNQPPSAKYARMGGGDMEEEHTNSVVGQPGMPEPAARPKGPKLKFTSDDDLLLVELKEQKNLTWKQIADFFPGRSSGTLQVRYCTKLKAKTTIWTEEMMSKLRQALEEYETDRWRIVSSKVGNGFTPQACQMKAEEMDEQDECATIVNHDSQAAAAAQSQAGSDGGLSPASQIRRDTVTSYQLSDSGSYHLDDGSKPRQPIPVSGVSGVATQAMHRGDDVAEGFSHHAVQMHHPHHISTSGNTTPSPSMPYNYPAPPPMAATAAHFDVMVSS